MCSTAHSAHPSVTLHIITLQLDCIQKGRVLCWVLRPAIDPRYFDIDNTRSHCSLFLSFHFSALELNMGHESGARTCAHKYKRECIQRNRSVWWECVRNSLPARSKCLWTGRTSSRSNNPSSAWFAIWKSNTDTVLKSLCMLKIKNRCIQLTNEHNVCLSRVYFVIRVCNKLFSYKLSTD